MPWSSSERATPRGSIGAGSAPLAWLLLCVCAIGCEPEPERLPEPTASAVNADTQAAARRAALSAIESLPIGEVTEVDAQLAEAGWHELALQCARGDAVSCRMMARLDPVVRLPQPVVDARRPALEASCAQNVAVDCYLLGRLLDDDRGRPVDGEAAFEAYGRGCEGGVLASCARQAVFYVVSVPSREPDADARGFELAMRACDGGLAHGCDTAALIVRSADKGLAADPARADALMARACELGLPSACTQPAWRAYEDHVACTSCDEAAREPLLEALLEARRRSRALDEQACAEGLSVGCLELAIQLSPPSGGAEVRDDLVAADIARLASECEGGRAAACTVTGVLLADEASEDALNKLDLACSQGHAPGCVLRKTLATLP